MILEFFGLILDDDLKEVETIHQYFNPGKPIPALITKITGITDEMVKDAPKFSEKSSFIEHLIQSSDVVVAHNLSYDKSVVDFEFKRLDQTIVWPRCICTVESTESIKGYRLSLGALHQELFNEPFENAHRAENDVRALARCYIELIKRGEV